MIYELHRKTPNNIGDYWCNPSRYFKFENLCSEELMHNNSPTPKDALIVGGGGLIHKKFQLHINRLLDKNPRVSALWGIGHNFGKKHIQKTRGQVYYPKWVHKASLVGIRDWIQGHRDIYLPCVTCMHPAFDKLYEVKHDAVFYTHAFKSKYQTSQDNIHMSNDQRDFDTVISFLGSANTVITDSYHGAYWAQLLGKDVRVVSWSVKFDHMRYPPSFLEHITKWHHAKPSLPSAEYLDESRELNTQFYQKFLTLL